MSPRPWHDAALPIEERLATLLAELTAAEKLAQLGSVWDRSATLAGEVAPMQDVFSYQPPWDEVTEHGLGHITRAFGTAPISPTEGARYLTELQKKLISGTRLGIPAIAHEECLTGFTTYQATIFPTPLALAASFDPDKVEAIGRAIGESMRKVGVHQGLSPVLDVVRDYRWGRVEETMGEDPYLVGIIGSSYVRGLESAGIIATLKHFAGYSASQAARNHAPVSIGPREFADVITLPFEMALREGGARSVMNSYSDIDGVPAAAHVGLLTDLLRDEWGFTGTVVSDYWAVAFLHTMHQVAADFGQAGAQAMTAGIDVELPNTLGFGPQLAKLIGAGEVSVELLDRAVSRVLRQKLELGLLDADYSPKVDPVDLDFDPPAHRDLAREVAEESIILLQNKDNLLPLADASHTIAVVGPNADDALAFLGCYSYPNHVLPNYPDLGTGVEVPTFLSALAMEFPNAELRHVPGVAITGDDVSGIPEAVEAAKQADLVIAVLGDRAGLFGQGTSGEGCDVPDLNLPGMQGKLLDAILETGKPATLVMITGRPYALGAYAEKTQAIIQAFLPGEEAASAITGVLSGRVNPTGKLPVQIPARPSGGPSTYLHAPLAGYSFNISNLDPRPLFPFGHGLSYATYEYSDFSLDTNEIPVDGTVEASVTVTNVSDRTGAEIVHLYFCDPIAEVTRPVLQLLGFTRIPLQPNESKRATFTVHADRFAYTGIDLYRIVESGEIKLTIGSQTLSLKITGQRRKVGPNRVLTTGLRITESPRAR